MMVQRLLLIILLALFWLYVIVFADVSLVILSLCVFVVGDFVAAEGSIVGLIVVGGGEDGTVVGDSV